MLNRDQDRERGLPLCWLFEAKALIGMVLIPMFLLVSFGFESLPLPRLLKAVILDFFFVCRVKFLTFPYLYKFFHFSSGLSIKQNEKPGWKHKQKKRERKSKKGGRSLVLVLTETSLSNFHFWVVSLFSYLEKDKTSLSSSPMSELTTNPLLSFFFLRRISVMTNAPLAE